MCISKILLILALHFVKMMIEKHQNSFTTWLTLYGTSSFTEYVDTKNLWYFYFFVQISAWKVFRYRVISGPCFPVFGLNTAIYSVNLRIQSKYRKIRTRNNSVFGHFSRTSKQILKVDEEKALRKKFFICFNNFIPFWKTMEWYDNIKCRMVDIITSFFYRLFFNFENKTAAFFIPKVASKRDEGVVKKDSCLKGEY